MNTENNHISNNSFNMIQYKLSDFEFYKPSFDEVLDERLNKTPDFEINDPEFELLENNLVRYINPECPECKSHKIIKYGVEHKEKINTAGKITEYQEQQYYCKKCYHRFGIKNNPLTTENSKFLTEIKDKCTTRLKEGYESLRQLSRNLKNYNNITVSHVSIHNWIKIDVNDTIINKQKDFSGYYLYDEEYLKINGKRRYRLTLYDMKYNIPLAERITDNKQYNTVLKFLKETTKYKPFKVLATDLFPMYRNIADELGVKHQLCLIHLNREINKKVKNIYT